MILLLVDISESTKLWIKFEGAIIEPLVNKMSKIGAELAKFVFRRKVLQEKVNLLYRFTMLELLSKECRWTFSVLCCLPRKEIDICSFLSTVLPNG